MKFYIVDNDKWNDYKPKMIEALGHPNVSPRYSVDGTKVLMEFDPDNLPDAFVGIGYTEDEIQPILKTSEWTKEDPTPLDAEERNKLARQYGQKLMDNLFVFVEGIDGITKGQMKKTLNDYKDVLGFLERGFFGLILDTEITSNGILPQEVIDQVVDNIQKWENDHPKE